LLIKTSYFAIVLVVNCLCIKRLQQVETSKLSLHLDNFLIIFCAWGSLKLPGNGDSQQWITTIGDCILGLIFVKRFVFVNEDEIDELKKEQKTLTIGFFNMAHPWKKPRHQGKTSTNVINNK